MHRHWVKVSFPSFSFPHSFPIFLLLASSLPSTRHPPCPVLSIPSNRPDPSSSTLFFLNIYPTRHAANRADKLARKRSKKWKKTWSMTRGNAPSLACPFTASPHDLSAAMLELLQWANRYYWLTKLWVAIICGSITPRTENGSPFFFHVA